MKVALIETQGSDLVQWAECPACGNDEHSVELSDNEVQEGSTACCTSCGLVLYWASVGGLAKLPVQVPEAPEIRFEAWTDVAGFWCDRYNVQTVEVDVWS